MVGSSGQKGSASRRAAFVLVALATTLALALIVGREEVRAGASASAAKTKKKPKPKPDPRPNIVVVMTDDQTVGEMKALPQVRSLIGDHGVTFNRSYVTTPLCCPARATYLTGQYAHNHKVVTNVPPFGGYPRLKPKDNTLPVWLQRAGYYTAHIGKYLNSYVRKSGVPPGWSDWHGALDPSTYQMWGYTLNENGRIHTYGEQSVEDPALYQTDVYSRKAAKIINRQAPRAKPFFLSVAPLAPHGERLRQAGQVDPRPAPRHAGAFATEPLPRPPVLQRGRHQRQAQWHPEQAAAGPHPDLADDDPLALGAGEPDVGRRPRRQPGRHPEAHRRAQEHRLHLHRRQRLLLR